MKRVNARKLWFLMLNICICASFGYATLTSSLISTKKHYADNFSEKSVESDEKLNENPNSLFLAERTLEICPSNLEGKSLDLLENTLSWSSFWPSPNTPPPDFV